jgi:hypothetical protein
MEGVLEGRASRVALSYCTTLFGIRIELDFLATFYNEIFDFMTPIRCLF